MGLLLGATTPAGAQQAPSGTPAASDPSAGGPETAATASPENPSATREARERFRSGLEAFQARRFRVAIQEFELAAQLVPSADLWFNIARAHEELGHHGDAAAHYRLYLRDRVDPPDAERIEAHIMALDERAEAARRAAQERPVTGTLRLRANRDGAAFAMDGRPIGETPVDMPLTVAEGRHEVELMHPGQLPFRAAPTVAAGTNCAVYADLAPSTEYEAKAGSRWMTWIAAGLATVALGASVVFGVQAAGMADDDPAGARDRAAISDYSLGAALLGGLAAVALYHWEGRAIGTETVATP